MFPATSSFSTANFPLEKNGCRSAHGSSLLRHGHIRLQLFTLETVELPPKHRAIDLRLMGTNVPGPVHPLAWGIFRKGRERGGMLGRQEQPFHPAPCNIAHSNTEGEKKREKKKLQKRSASQANKLTFHSQKALRFTPRAKHVHICDSFYTHGCQFSCTNH